MGHAKTARALASFTVALLCLGVSACGGATTTPLGGAPTRARSVPDTDDTPNDRHYDRDDEPIRYFGHAAGVADQRAVTALVRRYYVVAAAGDGATACLLLASPIAGSVVEAYGGSVGPPALRGKTCAAVISKLFKERRRQLAADNATLKVTGVRVKGDRAYALLSATTMPVGDILLRREQGAWRIWGLLGGPVG